MTVLVVDSQSDVAELVQLLLEEEGHGCLIAKDLEEAEMTVQMASVDAMALALDLPGRDPLDWLEVLCLSRPELAKRTIVIAGRDLTAQELLRIQGCGAGVLQKPFQIESFRDALFERVERAPAASGRPGEPAARPAEPTAGSGEAGTVPEDGNGRGRPEAADSDDLEGDP